jgi:hypothetical protein
VCSTHTRFRHLKPKLSAHLNPKTALHHRGFVFCNLLDAAAFWSARRTDFFCLPGFGLQLPFSTAALPGVVRSRASNAALRKAFVRLPFCGNS